MADGKTLIFIPTYNEAENVGNIFKQIRDLKFQADILFLDDNSPDGTGKIIDDICRTNKGVYAIHRRGKEGIGSAHQAGIAWAYQHDYRILITMDCDFSHSPAYILDFVKYSLDHDVVVGSRYMQEGSLKDWSLMRKILTHLGHFLTSRGLGLPYDATGAFRLYRLDRVPQGVFGLVQSRGYSFFFESLYVIYLNKFSIKEFPIKLPARTYGHSKMNIKDVVQSVRRLIDTYWRSFLNRKSYIYVPPVLSREFVADSKAYVPGGELNAAQVQQDWDKYWAKKKSANILYDIIAEFYRIFIIRPILSHFIKKHFAPRAKVLHAGCGGGQVDVAVASYLDIWALDISKEALAIYQKTHKGACKVLHGDIFHIPSENAAFDGIYNLGVMEHFTPDEIQKILVEFNRVLKPQGKMVLFWPPEFGLTVRFLDSVHFVLNKIFKLNVKLHPDEITRVRSREQMSAIFARAGFKMDEYYFGIRDFFTYTVMAVSKAHVENSGSWREEKIQLKAEDHAQAVDPRV